jgi:D-xylose 1-dehydrogenase (NADP+, D-xylono-1,5-lactone-forming)
MAGCGRSRCPAPGVWPPPGARQPGVPSTLPRVPRGYSPPVSRRGTVRWGILGTGHINDRFLEHAREARDAEFVAVGSRTTDRAGWFAQRFGIERAHASYEDLLEDPDVDAVYVNVPNSLHHLWTMAALHAGKHVLCEKPYSRRPAEVVEAFDAAEARGLRLMEAFMWRHSPQARHLPELLAEIGDLRAIRATFSFTIGSLDDVRLGAELDGGSLMDVGCYCVNGARLVAGREPVAAQATQLIGPSGVDVRFAGLLDFGEGLAATIHSGFDSDHATLEAIGERGTVRRLGNWGGPATLWLNDREVETPDVDPYRAEVENLTQAILGRAEPLLGRVDALGQARSIEALYRAAETGTRTAITAPKPATVSP